MCDSEALELFYINTGGDAPLTDTTDTTDTTATQPQAALLSPPVVSRKFVYSEEMVVFKMTS